MAYGKEIFAIGNTAARGMSRESYYPAALSAATASMTAISSAAKLLVRLLHKAVKVAYRVRKNTTGDRARRLGKAMNTCGVNLCQPEY